MKRMLKGLVFSTLMLLSMGAWACCSTSGCSTSGSCCTTDSCCTDCDTVCGGGYTHFNYRSQGWNIPRELVGWQSMVNRFEMEELNGAFYITPQYTRSFKPCRIANYLIGEDLVGGKLTISGSRKGHATYVARGAHEWLADYFGLGTDFVSEVTFTPRISNFIVDFGLYLGLDNVTEGLFFRLHAPLAYTKWQLGMKENVVTKATLGFDAGYMSNAAITTGLPADFTAAMKGVTWGDMQEALKYGKIDCCKLTKTRLADIEAVLGWNFLLDEDYHMGLGVMGVFPTGNKQDATYLFSPVVGNGGHFELGGMLTSSARLWTSDDEESSFWVYMDAKVAHLFKRKMNRSYDLTGKPNSRYMLIEEFTSTVANLYAGAAYDTPPTAPKYQYAGKLYPLINKTTCCTDVSFAVQGELALKFTYYTGNFSFDLGYNLWGRSGEKRCNGCALTDNKYALKGDAFVYGITASNATGITQGQWIALSATESNATINAGTNTPTGTAFLAGATATRHVTNPAIDNFTYAFAGTNAANNALLVAAGAFNADNRQRTSSTPKFLKASDLNTAKMPSALSHKVFAHMSYVWADDMEEDGWEPFIGLGGEAEFSGKSSGNYSAVSQWGVWVKGGISYN